MDIKILVATHKAYWMPDDDVYLPLHVGREGKQDLGFTGDNTGENISSKNDNYCELTGLYWAWKNLSCDYIGLVHYRRYFNFKNSDSHFGQISIYPSQEKVNDYSRINQSLLNDYLSKNDIILPKKFNLGMTMMEHYKSSHIASDWDLLKNIALKLYPEYETTWYEVEQEHKIYICNMFIAHKKLFDGYMQWLFSILFELEKHIKISNDPYQKRVFGFMSERLFNIYIRKHNLKIKELPIVFFDDNLTKIQLVKNKIKEYI